MFYKVFDALQMISNYIIDWIVLKYYMKHKHMNIMTKNSYLWVWFTSNFCYNIN